MALVRNLKTLLVLTSLASLLAAGSIALATEAPPDGVPVPSGYAPRLVRTNPTFEGFFFHFGLGYATTGGQGGPEIPNAKGSATFGNVTYNTTIPLHAVANYNKFVTTDVGSGAAINFQIGYNIKGYASLWLDIFGHGNPSATKSDLAGSGAIAVMAGVHPLRFWRSNLPADVKLYGGYAPFEVLGYNENEWQTEYKGKGWTGTSIPFGMMGQWKPLPDSIFTLGLDLRWVHASYEKWYYNWDKDQFSAPSSAITTLRFEPRLTIGLQL
jgi:hypothetical protein